MAGLVQLNSKQTAELRKGYPDLITSDYSLIEFYLTAEANKDDHPRAYEAAKKGLLSRFAVLIKEVDKKENGAEKNIAIMARLINMQLFIRLNGVTDKRTLRDLAASLSKQNDRLKLDFIYPKNDPRNKTLMKVLSLKSSNKITYLYYIQNIVKGMFSTPHVSQYIKIVHGNKNLGAAAELARYIVTDTYSEKNHMERSPWEIASNIIHEAAHIEFYMKYLDGEIMVNPLEIAEKAEEYAYTKQLEFLDALVKGIDSGEITDINKDQVQMWTVHIKVKVDHYEDD
jgi:hypothetical protein